MPESTAVKALARKVAKRLGKSPWHAHRDEVLPQVYMQLQLGEYRTKKKKKKKRTPPPAPECSVCLMPHPLLVLAPCGHMCVCSTCCPRLERCPLCREAIAATVAHVY